MRRRYHARLLWHAVFCAALAYSAIVLRAQSNSALSPPFTLDLRVSPNPEAPVLSWVGSTFSDIFTLDLRVETLGGVASAWSVAFSVDLRLVPGAPSITGIRPNPVIGSNSPQTITINGANFVHKPTVTLTWTGQPDYRLPDAQLTFVSSTELRMAITTGTARDTWTVKVTNPDGRSSAPFGFVVGAFVRLVQPQVPARGGFQFTVVGDVIGTLQAEYSDDLLTWKAMSPPLIHELPATVSDPNPSPTDRRYYRVVAIP